MCRYTYTLLIKLLYENKVPIELMGEMEGQTKFINNFWKVFFTWSGWKTHGTIPGTPLQVLKPFFALLCEKLNTISTTTCRLHTSKRNFISMDQDKNNLSHKH